MRHINIWWQERVVHLNFSVKKRKARYWPVYLISYCLCQEWKTFRRACICTDSLKEKSEDTSANQWNWRAEFEEWGSGSGSKFRNFYLCKFFFPSCIQFIHCIQIPLRIHVLTHFSFVLRILAGKFAAMFTLR